MPRLRFGTAGIPLSTCPSNTLNGICQVRKLGLDAMELEFVRNVNVSKARAPEVKKVAKEHDVALTCHASYFINLNAKEKKKREASKHRLLDAARIAWLCGAKSICFHAGFYLGMSSEQVFQNIKKAVEEVRETLRSEGNEIWLRPETTGKPTQFGSLDELLRLSTECEHVMPCVDFAHIHARAAGKQNDYGSFCKVLENIEKTLGRDALINMHIHVSGIAYSEKGEKHHLNLKESDLRYTELLKAFKQFDVCGVVISESPNIEDDAILMKRTYERLK
jgi:deoxyribonuclease-4